MQRREFIAALGGAAAGWPLRAMAQQATLPIIGFVSSRSPRDAARYGAVFRTGLRESGIIDGQSVIVEYHWLEGQYDQVPSLVADLVRKRVTVIASAGSTPVALAAKAATPTIPIVFGVVQNPVDIGLVASLARPGSNATGINFFNAETVAKRLELLHQVVPKAVRVAVLVNPANAANAEFALRATTDAARALGLEIRVVRASSAREIEAAFASLAQERTEALLITPDGFLSSRRVQFAILAARHGIPTAGIDREAVEAGALISYGTDPVEMYHDVGVYAGRILKGAKPADLPVVQSTKFEFIINLTTATALGLEISPTLLALTDELIE